MASPPLLHTTRNHGVPTRHQVRRVDHSAAGTSPYTGKSRPSAGAQGDAEGFAGRAEGVDLTVRSRRHRHERGDRPDWKGDGANGSTLNIYTLIS